MLRERVGEKVRTVRIGDMMGGVRMNGENGDSGTENGGSEWDVRI